MYIKTMQAFVCLTSWWEHSFPFKFIHIWMYSGIHEYIQSQMAYSHLKEFKLTIYVSHIYMQTTPTHKMHHNNNLYILHIIYLNTQTHHHTYHHTHISHTTYITYYIHHITHKPHTFIPQVHTISHIPYMNTYIIYTFSFSFTHTS